MADYYRQFTRLLASAGFKKVPGGKGSHEKWESDVLCRRVIVPRNLKKRHTANGILKSAGLSKRV